MHSALVTLTKAAILPQQNGPSIWDVVNKKRMG